MTGLSRRVLGTLLIGAFLAMTLTACDPSSPESMQRATLTALPANRIPHLFASAGFRTALRLPAGWDVAEYGASGDGAWLAITATESTSVRIPASVPRWTGPAAVAIDVARRQAWIHPAINTGWYSGSAIAVQGWLVHEEKQQLDGSQCPDQDQWDCFIWKLYAQPADRAGSVQVLASSAKPGSQFDSPIPVLAGGTVFWAQGSGPGYAIRSWRPGQRGASDLATRPVFQNIEADGNTVVSVVRSASGTTNWDIRAVNAEGSLLGSLSGRPDAALRGRRILYLPERGDANQSWRIGAVADTPATTAASTRPIALQSFDAIHTEFVTDRIAYAQTESTLALIDVEAARVVARIPVSTGIGIARCSNGRLAVVQQAAGSASVVYIR